MNELSLTLPFVLVVSTEHARATRWKPLLRDAGINSHVSENISGALAIAIEWKFDAVILSVHDEQVGAFLHALEFLKMPKIVLSEEYSEIFVITALEAGACCVMREPVAAGHLKVQLARVLEQRSQPPAQSAEPFSFGPLMLEPKQMNAFVGNVALELTKSEFEILKILVANGGKIVARKAILIALRYSSLSKDPRSGDMHICRIRKKLANLTGHRVNIKTFRNYGYQLCE